MEKKFIAVIKSGAVRDVQFCTNVVTDPLRDEFWEDLPEAEVFLGVYEGKREEVLAKAAVYAQTSSYNIRLIEV